MSDVNRRSFLGTALGAAVATKLPFREAVADEEIPIAYALGLVRTLNAIQAEQRVDETHYSSREQMLGPNGLRKHQARGVQALAWMAQLNFDSDEILPGWFLGFAAKPAGYILTLIRPRGAESEVLITDESGMIARTVIGKEQQIQ